MSNNSSDTTKTANGTKGFNCNFQTAVADGQTRLTLSSYVNDIKTIKGKQNKITTPKI